MTNHPWDPPDPSWMPSPRDCYLLDLIDGGLWRIWSTGWSAVRSFPITIHIKMYILVMHTTALQAFGFRCYGHSSGFSLLRSREEIFGVLSPLSIQFHHATCESIGARLKTIVIADAHISGMYICATHQHTDTNGGDNFHVPHRNLQH